MTRNLMVCRIIEEAAADIKIAAGLLSSAQPEQLESARRLLGNLVDTLGEIESAARLNPFLAIKDKVRGLHGELGRAAALSSVALSTIDRHAQAAGHGAGVMSATLCLQA